MMDKSMTDLFDCEVPVEYRDLVGSGEIGLYLYKEDKIVLCKSLEKEFPFHRKIVFLHEMFHATGGKLRSYRTERLTTAFGRKAYNVEECIAEICTMVAMKKLGWFTETARTIPELGLKEYHREDIYIPWMEVIHAVEKFKVHDVDFSQELSYIKKYLTQELTLNIKDRYEWFDNQTA